MTQLNQQLIIDYRIKPEYSFSNFVKTLSTEVAYNAAVSVARKPGQKYNPLCIYGDMGVGKTHLLSAIGKEAMSSANDAVIVYVNSKFILAEQEKANNEFDVVSLVKEYNHVDFLIIDDIDEILKKSSIDEKVFHLYNYLMQKGKQLIFSSSIPANQLKFTDQNLKSRLESGLSVKIEKMNDEDKRKVIKKLAKDFEVFIPNNVVDYILSSAPRDFISLYNIVSRINRLSLETKKKITLPLVRNLFKYVFLKV
ncbi:MAG: DnaA/Hda family protein [Nitrospinota bacterium]|jgi:chromosomal replication initiator protein|nr:DnaA/Hda family protein [Nitrospinota bacterium]HJN03193.1 DnaA/Hda family protein [Nitrospinota bacterium]